MTAPAPSADSENDDVDVAFAKYIERRKKIKKLYPDQKTNNITLDEWKGFRERILFHMKNTYPLIHGGVICLAYNFIKLKQKYGSSIERKFYAKMSMVEFFDRLATKRAVVFFKSSDEYILTNGESWQGGWDNVGTEKEGTQRRDPKLERNMSYDELMISAMCGISSVTHFINNGNRRNVGSIKDFAQCQQDVENSENEWPKEGIYMGLVGARFERSELMEHGLMAVSKKQNDKSKGYGAFDDRKSIDADTTSLDEDMDLNALLKRADDAQKFYGKGDKPIYRAFESWYDISHLPTYDEVTSGNDSDRYLENKQWGGPSEYLDMNMFKARIRVSMELFLFDADKRAQQYQQMYSDVFSKHDEKIKKGAYCHVVGLGTGVWALDRTEQNRAIVAVVKEIIESSNLQYVDCVYFGWFTNDAMWDSAKEQTRKLMFSKDETTYYMEDKKGHRVDIAFGKRNPAGPRGEYELCLLTAMYAWDSNSFPGNEYYLGMLAASGDPAAAACSTIPYVQNCKINTEYVNGKNSHVFFYDPDSNEYDCYRLEDMEFEKNPKKWLEKSLKSVPYKRDRFAKNYGGHSLMDDSKESADEDAEDAAFLNVKAHTLTCHSSTKSVQIKYSTSKRMAVNVNPSTTLRELYAHAKVIEKGRFILLNGTPPYAALKDPNATMESLGLLGGTVNVKRL